MIEADNDRFGIDSHRGVGAVRSPATLEREFLTTA